VKRWSGGNQVLRWAAAGLLVVEKRFHLLAGYRELTFYGWLSKKKCCGERMVRLRPATLRREKRRKGSSPKFYEHRDKLMF